MKAYHFWSPTCAPCKAIKPAIEDLKEEFEIEWISVNIQDDPHEFARAYSVSVVPTIVVSVTINGLEQYEKHSGTNIAGYYRILRNGLRTSQQSST